MDALASRPDIEEDILAMAEEVGGVRRSGGRVVDCFEVRPDGLGVTLGSAVLEEDQGTRSGVGVRAVPEDVGNEVAALRRLAEIENNDDYRNIGEYIPEPTDTQLDLEDFK